MFHSWNQAFRILGFLGCSPNINQPNVGNNVKYDSFDHITYFQSSDVQVLWSSHHLYCLLVWISVIKRFSNCSSTKDVGFVKLLSDFFCGNRVFKMNIEFCCHLCYSSPMIFRHNSQCMVISFNQFWFLPTVPLSWWCLPMICVCCHNLGNCCPGHT